jgi:gliding motility-associated-like protein
MFKQIFMLFAMTALLFSCNKEECAPCCATTDHVEENWGSISIFIPNTFTPNGDGVNDAFYVITDNALITVTNFEVKDGATTLYSSTEPNPELNAWNGGAAEAIVDEGNYDYEVSLTNNNGESRTYRGTLCLRR